MNVRNGTGACLLSVTLCGRQESESPGSLSSTDCMFSSVELSLSLWPASLSYNQSAAHCLELAWACEPRRRGCSRHRTGGGLSLRHNHAASWQSVILESAPAIGKSSPGALSTIAPKGLFHPSKQN